MMGQPMMFGIFEDTLDALFRQPPPLQLVVFVINGLIDFGAGMLLIRIVRRWGRPEDWTPVSTFQSTVTVVFALFLAFHAAGIWANKSHAEHTHIESGTAVKRLDDLLGPQQLNLAGPREALHRYVRHVLKDEWRKTTNYASAPEAEQAFLDLHIRTMAAIKDLPPAVAGQLLALLNEAARARSERLWVGANHTEAVSWLAVMFLGLLAHLAVASVHIDKPKAGKLGLGLFATATTVALWSLGIVDDPFRFLQNLDPGTWLGS
jgi:hypothetical protein